MKYRFISLLLCIYIVLCVASCSSPNKNEDQPVSSGIPYTIDLTKFIEQPGGLTGVSDIADSITYVVLKASNEVPMGEIRQVHLGSEHIFIIEKGEFSIFIFDYSGKFIRKINHYGRGPGEYYDPKFTFNDNTEEIAIWTPGKVLIYDINDNLLKTLKIKEEMLNFGWLDKDLYLLQQSRYMMEKRGDTSSISSFVINSNGEIIARHKYFEIEKPPKDRNPIGARSVFQKCDKGILLKEPFNDTVFLINHDGIRLPYSIINYGSHKAPRDVVEGSPVLSIGDDMKYFRELNPTYFSQYALVEFFYRGLRYQGIWDFKKEKAMNFPPRVIKEVGIEDDIDGGPPCLVRRKYSSMQYFYKGIVLDDINPIDLLEGKSIKPRKGSGLEKIMENLAVTDDPILRIVHLKKKIE